MAEALDFFYANSGNTKLREYFLSNMQGSCDVRVAEVVNDHSALPKTPQSPESELSWTLTSCSLAIYGSFKLNDVHTGFEGYSLAIK